MIFVFKPYSLLFLAGSALSLILAIVTWKRRPAPGALPFSLFSWAIFLWSCLWFLEIGAAEISSKLIWAKLEYLGILTFAPFWLIFTLEYAGRKWKNLFNIALLTAVPLITFGVVCTNEMHGWFWTNVYFSDSNIGRVAVWEHGFWFWIQAVYQYILIAYGLAVLWLSNHRKSNLRRKQIVTLTIAAIMPILINLVYVLGVPDLVGVDFTPLSIALTSIIYVFAIFRYHLLDVSSVARNTLVEKVPDGILVLNPEDTIVDLNPATERMLNISKATITGRKLRQIWPDLNVMMPVLDPGQHLEMTPAESGTPFDLDISLTPIYDGRDALAGKLIMLRDISERRQMERAVRDSEKRYSALVEQSNEGVILIQNGAYVFANQAVCGITGYPVDDLLGRRLPFPLGSEIKGLMAERKRLRLAGSAADGNFEIKITRKDGESIHIGLSIAPISYRDRPAQLVTMRDITHSQQAREELEEANRRLRELDKMKDNLLSTVSHELRTPLTSIKSFVEILLNYEEGRATQVEFLKIIDEESDRLARLINDFLDLSKIQAGSMQWKTVDLSLSDAVNTSILAARPLIQKAKLELDINLEPDLPLIKADRDKLIQVVTNLLGNATKFTPEGGRIKILVWSEFRSSQANRQWVTFSITDNGIGIAPENHHRIFENFGQVGDVLKDRPKGTGLGLPICKRIIENYGGQIWIESALGRGTTIYFSLPVAAPVENGKPSAVPQKVTPA